MKTDDPILVITKEIFLPDEQGKKTIKAEIKGQTFAHPIFQIGEQMFNMVTITRADNKTTWGIAFYQNPMDQAELADKVEEIYENPQTIKSPFS